MHFTQIFHCRRIDDDACDLTCSFHTFTLGEMAGLAPQPGREDKTGSKNANLCLPACLPVVRFSVWSWCKSTVSGCLVMILKDHHPATILATHRRNGRSTRSRALGELFTHPSERSGAPVITAGVRCSWRSVFWVFVCPIYTMRLATCATEWWLFRLKSM